MKTEDIIRMAREAGLEAYSILPHKEIDWDCLVDDLATFAALVAAAEREACAKVCDVTPPYPFRPSIEAAHAIRARSNP